MGDINSATTTNKALLETQQVTLDAIVDQNRDIVELLRELIEAIKEITDR